MLQAASADTKKATARGNSQPQAAPAWVQAPPVPTISNRAELRLQRKCGCGGGHDCKCGTSDDKKKKENSGPRTALHRKPAGASSLLDVDTQSFFEARLHRTASAQATTPAVSGNSGPPVHVGAVDDPLEHEADQIADRVMRMPENASHGGGVLRGGNETALRRKATGTVAQPQAPSIVHDVINSPGQPLDVPTRNFFEPRFGYDLSQVRIHTDSDAARSAQSVQAQAYAVGRDIAFGPGMYAPSTTAGRSLLAHELAHTIQHNMQQGSGVAQAKTIRRRRVPSAAELATLLDAANPDAYANKDGVVRELLSAWDEMTPAAQGSVQSQSAQYGFTFPAGSSPAVQLGKANPEQVLRFAQVLLVADPSAELGDPAAGNSPPRNAAEEANINTLVWAADKVFSSVASGANDADIAQVFGKTNVTAAKDKFRLGRAGMHKMRINKTILADRSGFDKETRTGGLTAFDQQIMLRTEFIDNPTDIRGQTALVHESMHAGNIDVKDEGGYPSQGDVFKAQQEPVKLVNAAHYGVIASRVLEPKSTGAFPGDTFTPGPIAPPASGVPAKAAVTDAAGEASQRYREAWTTALNVHSWLVSVFLGKDTWNPDFSQFLPYWSKVQRMTIHKRAGTAPAAATPAHPVTEIDIAQGEGVAHKLTQGQHILSALKPQEKVDLEKSATPAQTAEIAKGPEQEAPVLVSLIRSQKIGEITGPVDRDERAIEALSDAYRTKTMDTPRDPASFVD